MNQKQAFLAGNFLGLTGLLVAFLVVSPMKEKERKEYEAKQKTEAAAGQQPTAQQASQPDTAQEPGAGAPAEGPSGVTIVVTAKNAIKKGATIHADDLKLQRAGAANFIDKEPLLDPETVVDHEASKDIAKGEYIFRDSFKASK